RGKRGGWGGAARRAGAHRHRGAGGGARRARGALLRPAPTRIRRAGGLRRAAATRRGALRSRPQPARDRGARRVVTEPTDLFVYGTLQQGHAMGNLLATRSRIPVRARGWLWDLPAGYPALVPDPDGG